MHNLKKKVKNKTLILEIQVKTSRKLSIHTYLDSTSVLNSTPNRNMINVRISTWSMHIVTNLRYWLLRKVPMMVEMSLSWITSVLTLPSGEQAVMFTWSGDRDFSRETSCRDFLCFTYIKLRLWIILSLYNDHI